MTLFEPTSRGLSTPIERPRPLGARLRRGGTEFALYSSTAGSCQVRLFGPDGRPAAVHELAPAGDGTFGALVRGVGPGALYKFVLDGRELPDPYARFLPEGVHGPAMVVESTYRWRHGEGVARPLRELVFYELHVGTFTPAGTYDAARERLPYLADLGVTALELMPLAAFDGRRGWGYDGVALYAPFAPYGTPDQLRAFVDEAHRLGLAVVLDAVYNHLGPSGNYLAAYSPAYFTHDVRNAWGDSLDYASPLVRRLILDAAHHWLTEFRFDGLRLDAVHAIADPSPTHILRELAEMARALRPARLLIAEDERNDPDDVERFGLGAIWADDFHHAVQVTLTGERDGYYAGYLPGVRTIADTIQRGWLYQGEIYPPSGRPRGRPAPGLAAEAFVYCLQNHDQVGNRALGERLGALVGEEAYAAASALLLFLPMTPLLFMGQEWAASTPFQFFTDHDADLGRAIAEGRRAEFASFQAFTDPVARLAIPDPQDEATFARSRLRWEERAQPGHRRVLDLYRQLLHLRRTDAVWSSGDRQALEADAWSTVLAVRRWNASAQRLLLANFGPQPVPLQTFPSALWRTFCSERQRPAVQIATRALPDLAVLPPFSAVVLA